MHLHILKASLETVSVILFNRIRVLEVNIIDSINKFLKNKSRTRFD